MIPTKLWVISLADAADRRAQIEQTLRDVDLDWDFFEAHRSLQGDLYYRADASHSTHGRTLRVGELGCYSSHYATWQWLIDSDYEQMIVFEDDVGVDWVFVEQFAAQDFAQMNIPYLRLFAKIPPRWRYVATPFFDRYHHLIRFTGYALGTQAYLLTKQGAQQLLESAKAIRYPIDTFMDRYWEHGVANLAVYPFPVFERFQPSSIGSARFAAESLPLSLQLQFRMRRAADRLRMLFEFYRPEGATIRRLKQNLRNRFAEQIEPAKKPLPKTEMAIERR
ncbi:MAG TPA: glycosyltransferase family 25 protein [Spongiibacteraceae bacterium]